MRRQRGVKHVRRRHEEDERGGGVRKMRGVEDCGRVCCGLVAVSVREQSQRDEEGEADV